MGDFRSSKTTAGNAPIPRATRDVVLVHDRLRYFVQRFVKFCLPRIHSALSLQHYTMYAAYMQHPGSSHTMK